MDVYADIEEFDFSERLQKLQHENELCQAKMSVIAKEYKVLQATNEEIMKKNEILETNISTLLKTAIAEIARKDRIITELRTQVDDITIKGNKSQKNNFYKYKPKTNDITAKNENDKNQSNLRLNRSDAIDTKPNIKIEKEECEIIEIQDDIKPKINNDNNHQQSNHDNSNKAKAHRSTNDQRRYWKKSPIPDNNTSRNRRSQRSEERRKRSRSRSRERHQHRNNQHHSHRERGRNH